MAKKSFKPLVVRWHSPSSWEELFPEMYIQDYSFSEGNHLTIYLNQSDVKFDLKKLLDVELCLVMKYNQSINLIHNFLAKSINFTINHEYLIVNGIFEDLENM